MQILQTAGLKHAKRARACRLPWNVTCTYFFMLLSFWLLLLLFFVACHCCHGGFCVLFHCRLCLCAILLILVVLSVSVVVVVVDIILASSCWGFCGSLSSCVLMLSVFALGVLCHAFVENQLVYVFALPRRCLFFFLLMNASVVALLVVAWFVEIVQLTPTK